MTGQPTAVTNPNNVTTSSTYNTSNGRITGTAISGTASLAYAYSSGRLTTMTRSGYIPNVSGEKTQTYTMVYDSFGNMTGVKVGNRSLASYTYSSKNGQLSQMSYGNGNSVSYSYDNLERVQNVYYNGSTSPALTYSYMGEGTLGSLTDNINNRTYSYTYDSLNRLNAMTEKAGATTVQTYNASYDTANRLTGYNYQLSPAWDGTLGSTRSYGYTYNSGDGSLKTLTGPGGSFAYSYDDLKRLSSRELTVNGSTLINRQLTYLAGTGTNGTTLMVSSLTNKNASGGTISQYSYTYDALGNITAISGSTNATYTYDNQGQLLTETVGGVTYTYTYDTYGNLRSKTDGTTTDTYTYGDSQLLDLLTAYNGNTISYDAIGNPTTWYDGTTFTWVNGRRLASATNTAENLTASYTYDSDGLRLTKTINGVEHKYLWQGSKLVSEYYSGKELEFFYDESGNPYAFSYKSSATATPVTYYYLTNLQGDIVGILDSNGTTVAAYTYNAWGKLLSSTGDLASINPLRYRGYYYDAELGMYYLKSRYYDPEICRFINADTFTEIHEFIGQNLSSYCRNNPPIGIDSDGYESQNISIGKGWKYRIDPPNTNTNTQRHIHIWKDGKSYAQNEDGSPHDKNNNSGGKLPNWVQKAVQEATGWDYNGKRNDFFEKTNIEITDSGEKYIFADGQTLLVTGFSISVITIGNLETIYFNSDSTSNRTSPQVFLPVINPNLFPSFSFNFASTLYPIPLLF